MKTRMVVNLVAFVVITVGLVGYGILDLLGNPFQHQSVVSATFPDAAGVEPNFGVVLQGVVVGSINSVQLTRHGARVEIALRPGVDVPANVQASIGLANDLGEQQIELAPMGKPSSRPLQNGATVPVLKGGVPVEVGQVIGTASRLLKSIGAKQLNTVLATLGQGLAGQAQNLQSMMISSQQFSQEFIAYQQQFESLLSNSTPVLRGLANDGVQLRADLAATEVLANVLDQHRYNLVHLLANGASASTVANELLDATRPNLACVLHDFADLSANGAEPTNLSNLSVGLATNTWFFGAVAAISPTGPAKSLFAGDPYNANQEWLRTRLFIPPGSPPADQYPKPTQLNTVMPGAACDTEFGRGVGAASQTAAQFPVDGTHYLAPTASEAQVRGGGSSASTDAARSGGAGSSSPDYTLTAAAVPQSRPNGVLGWLGLLLAVPLGLALLVPRRRRYERLPVVASRAPTNRRRLLPDRKGRP
jgi:virulence factor Mce-like protein